ncbi:MAG TPA: tetratricopeptide repeat protein [Chthoniobacterales bacterium]|nr:tetratricopeptide repeat protein [Chthoniobacterales bacterium]
MNPPNFFAELRRRNVYKVAVAYAVVAWLLIQAASIFLPAFDAPPWVIKVFIIVIIFGFAVALIFSWAFEITPEGIKLESEIEPTNSIARRTGRKIVAITIALAVVAAGLFVYQLVRSKPDPSRFPAKLITQKSIAVLPFDNLSRDPDNAYFAEGVQDEILTRLAKVADLKVISRTSTQHFKSSPQNLPEIAQQLGVRNILEGSVQKSNDQVRVNVQLINAMTDAHLWADTYDRKLTDLFAVESDIAKTIADTLQAKLTGSEKTAIAARPTENPEAYELYLKGRFFWNKRTAADLRRSIDLFNQAIGKDPNYALAYAGLAQAWSILSAYNAASPADSYPQAELFSRKALAIDDTCAEALVGLASFKARYHFDVAGALEDYERAIQLNPNDATAHHWFAGDCFAATGQHAHEVAEMKRALELDPLSLIINSNLGVAYVRAGRLEEAVAQLRKAIELDDSFYPAHREYGLALELQGKIPEAIAQYEKATTLSDDPIPLGTLARIYGIAGRREEAKKIFEKLRQLHAQRYTAAYALALAALGVGDKTDALHRLEEGYREHDGDSLGVIRVDPPLTPLHGDPRFEALAEKIMPAHLFGAKAASQ